MIEVADKTKCCGCTACQQICTHHAITMQFDTYGHSYPTVDTMKCVNCNLCNMVCPIINKEKLPKDDHLENLPVYAVYNKDSLVREKSTSGGIFTILSEYVIGLGGIVFAAKFDAKFHIYHDSFTNLAEIDAFRGSKYAQSDLGDTFSIIKHELKQRPVLFVGTPCQVAGLKSFLRKEYDNLFTCDFICMGISSSKVWEDYLIDYWGDKKIEKIFFKDKRNGWHQWKMLVKYEHGEYLTRGSNDPFFRGYLSHLTYRPSCFECAFRTCRRCSDFTIADCWGIDKVNPKFDDNKGCTTLILQSDKACNIFDEIKEKMVISNYSIDAVMENNPYIVNKIATHPKREQFYSSYRKQGFRIAAEKYCMNSSLPLRVKIRNFLKKIYDEISF